MHGQHSGKRTRARFKDLHGALPQAAVFGHEQHHASHQCGTPDQLAMKCLISRHVPAGQAIAEQRGLFEAEAKTFAGDGVDSTRRVAHEDGVIAVHAPQPARDGDCASFVGSELRIFEAGAQYRKLLERVFQPQLLVRGNQRDTNFPMADGRNVDLAVAAPVQFHEASPWRDLVVAAESEA